ncbi:hypothetical protein MYCODSM44623_04367 [Mycobacterium intracellulare subsp. chimaera]|nr:hypothetical protein MYCODSM44623_04367 [Mycobacterium intracellulare subsp. chimaera]
MVTVATQIRQLGGGTYVTVVSKQQLQQMLSKDTKPTAGMDSILARRRARLARG